MQFIYSWLRKLFGIFEPFGNSNVLTPPRTIISSRRTVISASYRCSAKDIFLKGTKRDVLRSRSPISRKTLLDEGIDLFELDLDLLRAGVPTVPKSGMTTKAEK